MLEEHFIEWITLNTNQGIYRKQLNPGQEPVADFCLCDGEQVEEVYASVSYTHLLSMPAIVGADGIESDIPINLSGEEALKLKESAD